MIEHFQLNTLFYGITSLFFGTSPSESIILYGTRLMIGLMLSLIILGIVQMRAYATMDKKHIIAMSGAIILSFRYIIKLIFEWGWHIKAYNDFMLYSLFPPLEHYFYLIFMGCFAYYSLSIFNYYPGLLKKILWIIPIFFTGFLIYSSVECKNEFLQLKENFNFNDTSVNYQSHLIGTIISLYVFLVGWIKSKGKEKLLVLFWGMMLAEELIRTITSIYGLGLYFESILDYFRLSILPILILHFSKHFMNTYKYCNICSRYVTIGDKK